ncbi:hypothetical protein F5Y09DRAFT_338985 [Xylaria sp. FL1042]|nr:hypothetical protein F5Y09DRAFT_338985 [Xylaria sp. FL1042]
MRVDIEDPRCYLLIYLLWYLIISVALPVTILTSPLIPHFLVLLVIESISLSAPRPKQQRKARLLRGLFRLVQSLRDDCALGFRTWSRDFDRHARATLIVLGWALQPVVPDAVDIYRIVGFTWFKP